MYFYTVKASAFRCKIVCIGVFVITDRTADIAVKATSGVQHFAGQRVKQIDVRAGCLAIVCSDHNEIIASIGTSPIEASVLHHSPCSSFFLGLIFRIFIRQTDTNKTTVFVFSVPKAGIGVTVQYRDWAVRLTTQRIGVQPQGFQRFGAERLDTSIGQSHQQNAIIICWPVDSETGFSSHLTRCFYYTSGFIHAVNVFTGINNQAVVHKNRAADCIGGIPIAQFYSPIQHAVRCADRCLCACNAVVAVRAAEVCPFCVKINNIGVCVRLLQRNRHCRRIRIFFFAKAQNGLTAFIYDLQRTCLCSISVQRNTAIVSEAFRQREDSIVCRPDTVSSALFVNIDQSILRICLECNGSCCRFLYCESIFCMSILVVYIGYDYFDFFVCLSAI